MPIKRSMAAVLAPLCMMMAAVQETGAVPAPSFLHQLRQPDGEVFNARQWGDEFQAGWETESGYTLIFDEKLKIWDYAVTDSNGELTSSHHRAGTQLPSGLVKGTRPHKQPGLARRPRPFAGTHRISRSSTTAAPASAPVPAIRNIPVILINFSDTTSTYTADDFTTLLFGSGNGSFREYFQEVSGSALLLSPGPAGVLGWYMADYGHDYYGQPSGWGPPDTWPGDLAFEAASRADATVDFSVYDSDGDCRVDVLAVVHQGPAQEATPASADIWSHSWSLSETFGYGLGHQGAFTTNDICPSDPGRFMVVDDYIMLPETLPAALDPGISTIGVFAHEYGHALGLIDLYDSDRTSEGAGNWSLMASGSWGKADRLGDRPSHLDPWSKLALGWVDPVRFSGGESGRVLPAVEGSNQVWQFRDGAPAAGGEYFLVENRQKNGFDAALPGSGMLVWHIDESRSGNSLEWYPGCTTCVSHYKVALLQADNSYDLEQKINRGDGGDPFPGSSDRRSVSHLTSPASRLYNDDPAGFSLSAISDNGDALSADISLPDGIPPVTTLLSQPAPLTNTTTASFSFTANQDASFECRLDNGRYQPCSSPHDISGLADGDHLFSVRSINLTGTVESSPLTCTWRVDTIPPLTTLLVTPAPLTADLSGSFVFSTNETGTSYDCSLDNGSWSSCSSPFTVTELGEGDHTFAVRGIDQAGNSDPSPASFSWRISRNVLLSRSGQQDSFHPDIGSALSAVASNTSALLRTRNRELNENLSIDRCASIALRGGYAPGFTDIAGQTTILGSITVNCGKLSLNGIILRSGQ